MTGLKVCIIVGYQLTSRMKLILIQYIVFAAGEVEESEI